MNFSKICAIVLLVLVLGLANCGGDGGDAVVVPPPPPPPCEVTLSWTLPTERENGTPLAAEELVTVTLYAGRIPMAPDNELVWTQDVNALTLRWTITPLEIGLWYFQSTITDTEGLTSGRSNEVSKECLP